MSTKARWPTGIRPSGKGLQIRIFRGKKIIYQETISADPYRAADLAAAVKRRASIKARLDAGIGIEIQGDRDELHLFREAAQDYLNTLETKSRVTIEYHRILNNYWMPHLAGDIVQEIPTAKIKRIMAAWPVTSKTKKNRLIPLYGVFKHVDLQPPKIKLRKQQKKPVERYKPEERTKLLKHIHGQARLYFALLFGCGLRPGEALALCVTDKDGDEISIDKQITARRLDRETKTYTRRKVYLPQWVREIWDQHPVHLNTEYLFVNSLGTPYLDTDVFNEIWKDAHTKARLPYRLPYTCRHTRAAELLSIGVPPAEAASELGHTLQMFFNIYAELIEEYQSSRDRSRFEGVGLVEESGKQLAKK
ncbi:MAG: tyrosine-type recombinase/integrase [Gammaproteobacteria bacterium]